MGLSYNLHPEVSAIIRAECIAEYLGKKKLHVYTLCLYVSDLNSNGEHKNWSGQVFSICTIIFLNLPQISLDCAFQE